jgi:uncharacterized RDD family membrane protein YckC
MPEPAMTPSDTKVPPMLANIIAATPARIIWRALALGLDLILTAIIGSIILTTVVFPQSYPNAEAIIQQQMHSFKVAYDQANATGKMPEVALSQEYIDLSVPTSNTLFLVLLAYFAGSELLMDGSTLGKRVFGLRVARCWTAKPPTWIECLVRNIFKAASLMWIGLLGANIVVMLFRPNRRAIHDYLARTVVTGDAAPPKPPEEDHDS